MPNLTQLDLQKILDTTEEAIVVYDKDGGLVFWNQRFKDTYQYRDEDLFPGQHFTTLGEIDVRTGNVAIGDEYGSGEDYLERKREYRRLLQGSFIVQLKDGRWIKTTDRPLSDGGFVSVQTDITEMRALQHELEAQVQEETAKRMEIAETLAVARQSIAIGEQSSGYAHDLNNLLMVIETNVERLVHQKTNPKSLSDCFTRIDLAVQQARAVTKAMMDRSTEDSHREKVDVIKCLNDTVELFRSTSTCPIQWFSDHSEGDVVISGTRLELAQVVLNLLANASDAMIGQSGSIEVAIEFSTNPHEGRPDIGKLDPTKDYLVLSVSDTGRGIPEEHLHEVFEPYFTTKGDMGTGLGLNVVSRIMTDNRGAIAVESAAGVGTVILTYWPLDVVGTIAPQRQSGFLATRKSL